MACATLKQYIESCSSVLLSFTSSTGSHAFCSTYLCSLQIQYCLHSAVHLHLQSWLCPLLKLLTREHLC